MSDRPSGVSATAVYDPSASCWRDGDDTSAHQRIWSHPSGKVILDAHREGGVLHGDIAWDLPGEAVAVAQEVGRALGLPSGPTHRLVATYDRGVLRRARYLPYFGDGPDELSVYFADGKIDGPLTWRVTADDPVFEHGPLVLRRKVFKVPKPFPARLDATFRAGKLIACTFFDRDGAVLVQGPAKVTSWGQETVDVTGYIAGGFVADAAAFFPEQRPVGTDNPPHPALVTLPEPHRASALALDRLVRSQRLPAMGLTFDLGTWGFDCTAQGLRGAEDPRWMGLCSDGSGDMLLLDTTTGSVVPYAHEEDRLDLDHAFPSIDATTFCLLRVEAVARKRIPRAAVAELFERLGLPAGVHYLRAH